MKFGKIKKVMAAALAATMIMSSALMVYAEGESSVLGNSISSGSSSSSTGDSSVSGNSVSSGNSSSSTGDSSVSGNSVSSSSSSSNGGAAYEQPTYAETFSKSANAVISVAGKNIKTSVSGLYDTKNVNGAVVITPTADVKTALGLTDKQKPTIFVYDVDAKKSTKAMESINAVADALGADVVACLQIELGAKENGKWVTLTDGSVALAAGLPKKADTSLTYSVICVQEGGVITVLEDLDTNPDTVTFAVNAGLGAYAIVAK